MTKDYDAILYSILKPLVVKENPITLYHNVIDEDYNSQPKDFVVYKTGISDSPIIFGDGKVLLRKCDCDITVSELGTGNYDNSGYLVKQVEEILQNNNITYTKVSLGYVESTDSMQTSFDFSLT